ncbi:hypothetical protein MAPG_10915 [Magnaporthiopsis poae ATCC 64411]|uniref:Enoyl reductase (ER) domain-containing protein n=1 Tax=Magnaporthiopsis poae (strain ATCC 64411 / 73-15) TaxID=644358 RepID=A0A0C4EDV4_MAGP6|nr:hypothetical protein MAPG_10915 [Magnaporthiopsis poae ATCC 64411]
MSPADGAGSIEITDGQAASRYEWKPDVDFLNVQELFRTPQRWTYHPGTLDVIRFFLSAPLAVAARRVVAQLDRGTSPRACGVHQSQPTVGSSTPPLFSTRFDRLGLLAILNSLLNQLADTPAGPVATAMYQVCMNSNSLLSGSRLEDVLPREPLSLGASLHLEILQHLTGEDGEISCTKYVLSTPGYLAAEAEEKLFANMDYSTLNTNENPSDQGLADTSYDHVIAVSTLRETKNAQQSFSDMRKPLRPNGRLFLQKLCPSSRWSKLATAGFGAAEAVVLDAEAPYQLTATILTRPVAKALVKKVTVLVERKDPWFNVSWEKGAGMSWATHLADIGCKDPRSTISTVPSPPIASFRFSPSSSRARMIIGISTNFEWTIFNDRDQIARFHPFFLSDELLISQEAKEMATLNVFPRPDVSTVCVIPNKNARDSKPTRSRSRSTRRDWTLGDYRIHVRLFGIEAAGVVTRVGSDVSLNDLQERLAFSTYTNTLATVRVRIPDSLSFDQTGTMLILYFTAILLACGGMGLAAIQVAWIPETELYVTSCVAEFGTLLEIGKRYLIGDGKLDMKSFLVGPALFISLHDTSDYVIWKKDRRMASYHNKLDGCRHGGVDGRAEVVPEQRAGGPRRWPGSNLIRTVFSILAWNRWAWCPKP